MTIFEKIINKEIQAEIIFEDDFILAFRDINPKTKGHFLVIPKKHSTNLFDIDNQTVQKLFTKAIDLAKKQIKKLNAKGFNLVVNNNESAGQEVFHTHIHIIPSY